MEAKVYPKWIYGRYVSKMDTLEDMYPKWIHWKICIQNVPMVIWI